MKKVYRDRLLKLAEHLESGVLGHKKFDFATVTEGVQNKKGIIKVKCGTMGCALGELPIVFPRVFKYKLFPGDKSYAIIGPTIPVNSYWEYDVFVEARVYFGLSTTEVIWLFQSSDEYDGPAAWNKIILTDKATRKQVAKGIRNFVAWKEKNESETAVNASN